MIALFLGGLGLLRSAVIVRAYYAQGDRITPIRIGTATVALDFTLNLVLIVVHGRNGACHLDVDRRQPPSVVLAVLSLAAKSLSAGRRGGRQFKDDHRYRAHVGRRVAAIQFLLTPPGWPKTPDIVIPLAIAVAVYLAAARFLKFPVLGLLFAGRASEVSRREFTRRRHRIFLVPKLQLGNPSKAPHEKTEP